jgi:hypothetical protein
MSVLIWLIATLLGATWRVTVDDPHRQLPFDDRTAGRIYCFWHRYLLPLAYIFRNSGKTALVSKSKDGLLAAAVARRWGHEIVLGSSSRGGSSALREAIAVLQRKHCMVITPDGPRGPFGKVKPGVAQMALTAGAPVVAVTLTANSVWRLRSWDGFVIPKPFSRVTVALTEPMTVDDPVSGEAVESLRRKIEERLGTE